MAVNNFPNEVVDSNAALSSTKVEGSLTHLTKTAALVADLNLKHGALVIPSLSNVLVAPPPIVTALHPLLVLATRHPSVVAIGM